MDERAADTVQAASIQENSASEEIKEDVQEPGKSKMSSNSETHPKYFSDMIFMAMLGTYVCQGTSSKR